MDSGNISAQILNAPQKNSFARKMIIPVLILLLLLAFAAVTAYFLLDFTL